MKSLPLYAAAFLCAVPFVATAETNRESAPALTFEVERALVSGQTQNPYTDQIEACEQEQNILLSSSANTLNVRALDVGLYSRRSEPARINCSIVVPVTVSSGYYLESVSQNLVIWVNKTHDTSLNIVSGAGIAGVAGSFTSVSREFGKGSSVFGRTFFIQETEEVSTKERMCSTRDRSYNARINLVMTGTSERGFGSAWFRNDNTQSFKFNMKPCD